MRRGGHADRAGAGLCAERLGLSHRDCLFVGRRRFAARKERLPQLEVRVLVLIRILHRHRAHVADVAADVADATDAPLIVLIVLVLMAHLAFSLTKSINDEEEERERDRSRDAGED